LEPDQLVHGASRRPRRHLAPSGTRPAGPLSGLPAEPPVERAGPAELRDPLVRRELKKASIRIGACPPRRAGRLLFGIVGLALADPMVAMLKTALEQKSKEGEAAAAT
jgi:hypothetical protein